jgi:hypothetical protein
VLDLEGSGRDAIGAGALEAELDAQLRPVWGTHGKAIVVDPEVEVWLWGGETALRDVLCWPLSEPIRDWLKTKGFVIGPGDKPASPKEALDAMRLVHRQPRSAALYAKITGRISLKNCKDAAFLRLRSALQAWF